jgi:hypothetical protein
MVITECFGDADLYLRRPRVVPVVGIFKRDQESPIGDAIHGRENPLRAER